MIFIYLFMICLQNSIGMDNSKGMDNSNKNNNINCIYLSFKSINGKILYNDNINNVVIPNGTLETVLNIYNKEEKINIDLDALLYESKIFKDKYVLYLKDFEYNLIECFEKLTINNSSKNKERLNIKEKLQKIGIKSKRELEMFINNEPPYLGRLIDVMLLDYCKNNRFK
jgi:hypothetical protein